MYIVYDPKNTSGIYCISNYITQKEDFLMKYPVICNIIINHNIPHFCVSDIYNVPIISKYCLLGIDENDIPFAVLCGLDIKMDSRMFLKRGDENFLF